MKIEKIICDVCGNEIETLKVIEILINRTIEEGIQSNKQYHLCPDCINEITLTIPNHYLNSLSMEGKI
jgi:hypothetical protein